MTKIGDAFKKFGKWVSKAASDVWKTTKTVVSKVYNDVNAFKNKLVDAATGIANKGLGIVDKGVSGLTNVLYIGGGILALGLIWMLLNPGKSERIAMAGISKVPSPIGAGARVLS